MTKFTTILFFAFSAFCIAKPTAIIQEDVGAVLENDHLMRQLVLLDNKVYTKLILNKLDNKKLEPVACNEFEIELEDSTVLTSKDFSVEKIEKGGDEKRAELHLSLTNKRLKVNLNYTLEAGAHYLRKQLILIPSEDLAIKKISVDSVELKEAYQPYTTSQITSKGRAQWRPGLGQPLYTKDTGTYWGVEFPAAVNTVKEGKLRSSYMVGMMIKSGQNYATHHAVMGVSDKPEFVKEAFFDYIDKTRVRPLRLQTQYNSWFDYGKGVSADKMKQSIEKVSDELNTKRGIPPLKAYVIDDGWQNTKDDWSKKAWTVNHKFDPQFKNSFAAVKAAKSDLGLWLSPGCVFGGQPAIPKLRAAGHRALDPWMSMSHPAYMQKLEERMVELTEQGVTYFKLDGVFGHLGTRNFDIEGFKGSEEELNDTKYDDQKIQYLTDGSNRLIQIFDKMHNVNPDVYVVISNGAWLSPWWLQHIDAVWMINAGDAAGGADRTGELVYRDKVYYDLAVTENTQFPLHSIFNHEPKKKTSKETKETFRRYLYMNMSRGTGFVELYIKPFVLKDYDWDVLAEGMLWVEDVFPTFKHSKMHGGSPAKSEVYGYTAWLKERGYISLHNPSGEEKEYTIKLDRAFGLHPESSSVSFHLSSPLAGSVDGLKNSYSYGETISLKLKPKEIRILNFDSEVKDWSKLLALQTRTKEDYVAPSEPKPLP